MKTSRSFVLGLAIFVLACMGWLSNHLAASQCRATVVSRLTASLASHVSDPHVLHWVEPDLLQPDPFALKARACFPYTCFVPIPAASARLPYAWVRVGTRAIPFVLPVYSACLIGGTAGDGEVTLFFSPLGSRGSFKRKLLWVN